LPRKGSDTFKFNLYSVPGGGGGRWEGKSSPLRGLSNKRDVPVEKTVQSQGWGRGKNKLATTKDRAPVKWHKKRKNIRLIQRRIWEVGKVEAKEAPAGKRKVKKRDWGGMIKSGRSSSRRCVRSAEEKGARFCCDEMSSRSPEPP